MDSRALIDALMAVGQRCAARLWVPAGAGNFSVRLDEHALLLTASGAHKGRLTPADFLETDLTGVPRSASRQPSAETLLHCERYAALPDARCVLHTHSVAATVLGLHTPDDTLYLTGYELGKAFAGVRDHHTPIRIPLFDNDQDMPRLAAQVAARHARDPITHGYLIRGHGIYCWGETVEMAERRIEALEFLLACAWEQTR